MGYLTKSRWQSKTVWLGIATSVLSILGIFAGEKWIMEYPQIASGIGLTIGILTVVVRHFTSVPLMKGPSKQ
ncbi:hypothetical protein LCGC14_0249140 [marine sediment metagenome]|uniref:Holin n=1 Tax=marine sediment metagenome TaxID=412755 RepID=A0A0F9WQ92_9ZZZZ